MEDLTAVSRLCGSMVLCALKDAERGEESRLEALAWLASTEVLKFIDVLDIPQSSLLMRSEWRKWAGEALSDVDEEWTPQTKNHVSVIEQGLEYLQRLEERSYA